MFWMEKMMMVYVCFKQEPQSEDEYEVCDADDSEYQSQTRPEQMNAWKTMYVTSVWFSLGVNEGPEETTDARRPSMPTPRPRDL